MTNETFPKKGDPDHKILYANSYYFRDPKEVPRILGNAQSWFGSQQHDHCMAPARSRIKDRLADHSCRGPLSRNAEHCRTMQILCAKTNACQPPAASYALAAPSHSAHNALYW